MQAPPRNKIHFILTGGTIDSFYDGSKDTAVPLKHSVIPRYFKMIQPYFRTMFTEVCLKDSRQLTKHNLKKIVHTIETSPCQKIIVTHGTYTMPDTGRFLKANLKRHDQTIVLTGSMIPIDGFTFSDGPFNLGFAIAQINSLEPGIYLCMNGHVFSPEEVIKLLYKGRFASIFKER